MKSPEKDLIEKLQKIEALFFGAQTSGEKIAAKIALEKVQLRLEEYKKLDPPKEWTLTTGSMFEKKLLQALLHRYGLRPYRYHRQKYTTVMVEASESFIKDILWPEYQEMAEALILHLDKLTDQIIKEGVYGKTIKDEVRRESVRLT